MTTTLTLLHGGLRQPEMVAVPRAELDELRIDLTVSVAERVTFVSQVRHHAHLVMFALAKDRPADAEHHLTQIARLAAREDARARAMLDEPQPPVAAEARAA